MREVNFSIPNVNKASVGITTALYDRRALDCTSTLPLINSLNHLAYLTTSSARIRDILTVDGGIERLVCILKQGRSKDMMGMWKWNLAFQCVVNIGVRGTEGVRTRVVEADMVPVIATILDNYIKVVEKCREKAEEAKQKQIHDHHHRHREHRNSSKATAPSAFSRSNPLEAAERRHIRRHGLPPSIDVSATYAGPSTTASQPSADATSSQPGPASTDRTPTSSSRHHFHNHHQHTENSRASSASGSARAQQPLSAAFSTLEPADGYLRPVRDIERLASMAPFGPDLGSQPTSPTTPQPIPQLRSPTLRPVTNLSPTTRPRRRPSIRHQNSTAEADDLNGDSMPSDEAPDAEMTGTADIQSAVGIQDISMECDEGILADGALDLTTPTVSETHQEADTFNITHPGPIDGSIVTTANTTPVPPAGLSPHQPALPAPAQPPAMMSTTQPPLTSVNTVPRYLLDRHFVPNSRVLAAMPREEDVLMSLQLLAYVSKYCGLRSYFQQSHLVPKLKINKDLALLDATQERVLDESEEEEEVGLEEDEEDEEYVLPNDFNLFPLVEKFTVRYHSTDMQYWAGVVMRNLCRKDETRGGIRQCAYYQCGKWEEYTRQFAKCRRCRRTKYCSKECQKSAWAFHRHWCVAATA